MMHILDNSCLSVGHSSATARLSHHHLLLMLRWRLVVVIISQPLDRSIGHIIHWLVHGIDQLGHLTVTRYEILLFLVVMWYCLLLVFFLMCIMLFSRVLRALPPRIEHISHCLIVPLFLFMLDVPFLDYIEQSLSRIVVLGGFRMSRPCSMKNRPSTKC